MYKAQIVIKNGNEIIDQYYFSDNDKGKLLLCATSWFLGYLRGKLDAQPMTLQMPCVMSIDGYHAWSKSGNYTIKLVNAEGEIIRNIDSII